MTENKAEAKKVLIVDDDPTLLEIMEDLLTKLGYQPICCESVPLALKHLETSEFDIVMSDLYMPEVDGFDFLKMVKAKQNIPFIVMSGHPDLESLDEAKACDGILSKPFNLASIRELLLTVLKAKV